MSSLQNKLSGRLPLSSEVGQIYEINAQKGPNNRFYAKVVLQVFVSKGTQGDEYTYIPFFIAPKIWGKFKPLFKVGDYWIFHYELKGNSKPVQPYYCNAHFKDGIILHAFSINEENKADKAVLSPEKLNEHNPGGSIKKAPDNSGVNPMGSSSLQFNDDYDDDFGY